ncbi:MAG: capsular biosynthesis protein [Helicobacter sp.]|nr:capsular biosynthesis protein [Helicobacteraceae bacterium]MDY3112782.1 capsular biosynthesis protein [Helicobacter sp.]
MTLENRINDISGKSVLLLQGPMGTFFNKLFNICEKKGAEVFRIGFNYGDEYFALKKNYFAYKDKPKKWADFLKEFLAAHNISVIFLFGDCRFYHRIAISIARKLDIEVYVFEEGYLRPGFITLEHFGANSNSKIPKDRKFYDKLPLNKNEISPKSHSTYGQMAWWALQYYVISNILYFTYPHYIHHRDFSAFNECVSGIKNFFRKYYNKLKERNLEATIQKIKGKYYFVAIQTHDDFQVRSHSKFKTIEDFLESTLRSFIHNAPQNTKIVFKHHPMDRGKKNYTKFIEKIAKECDVEDRVIVVWDVHLPTLLKNAKAVVVINSTVGLSALYHEKPTICLGDAMYNIDGLTSKGVALNDFWTKYKKVDMKLYLKFRQYLIEKTQCYGSFYLSDKVEFD